MFITRAWMCLWVLVLVCWSVSAEVVPLHHHVINEIFQESSVELIQIKST